MVLPPQVYRSDWRETQAHLDAIFQATPLSCMLYNNPIAYGTDITPEQMIELRVRHGNFHAVKESSGDIRRITSLKHLGSLAILVGMDDVVVLPLGQRTSVRSIETADGPLSRAEVGLSVSLRLADTGLR